MQVTWPDGTKRSTWTAFTWQREPEPPKVLTRDQKNSAQTAARGRARRAREKALRMNAEVKGDTK